MLWGALIKKSRGETTLQQLADELDIDASVLSRIENGRTIGRWATVALLQRHFRLDGSEVLEAIGRTVDLMATSGCARGASADSAAA